MIRVHEYECFQNIRSIHKLIVFLNALLLTEATRSRPTTALLGYRIPTNKCVVCQDILSHKEYKLS